MCTFKDMDSFRSRLLRTNIKIKLYEALISSIMTHACLTWDYEAEAHPQNREFSSSVCELHVAYMYDYTTELCRTQAAVILNRVNPNVRGTQQEAMHRKYKGLKLFAGQAYDRSAV